MHSFYLCLLLFPFQLCFASGTMAVTIDSLCHRFFYICSGVALDSKRNQMCLVRHNSPFFSTRKWKVLWICGHFLLNLRSNNAIQGYFFFNMNCDWMLDVWRWLMLNITNKICAQNAILTFPNIFLALFQWHFESCGIYFYFSPFSFEAELNEILNGKLCMFMFFILFSLALSFVLSHPDSDFIVCFRRHFLSRYLKARALESH